MRNGLQLRFITLFSFACCDENHANYLYCVIDFGFFFVCLPIYDRNDSNVTIDGILFTSQQNEMHFTAKWKKIGLVSTFNSPLAKRQSIDCFFIVTKWQKYGRF